MERWFTTMIETEDFLQLDFNIVRTLLASSSLNIDTEIEVFEAAVAWLNYKFDERIEHVTDILLKVRFPLLSEAALLSLPNSSLCKSKNYVKIIVKRLIEERHYYFKDDLYKHKNNNYYLSRCCNQNMYDIFTCNGLKKSESRSIQLVDGNTFETVRSFATINHKYLYEAVCLKGEVYLVTRYRHSGNHERPIFKYSSIRNTWDKIVSIFDDRNHFGLCAFMNQIVVLGGCYKDLQGIKTCFARDVKPTIHIWLLFNRMNDARIVPAATVFEGRIVVSGGRPHNNYGSHNTVEAYDHVANEWSRLPSMIEARWHHSSVAVRNKLFVIGGRESKLCEVFDSASYKFNALNSTLNFEGMRVKSVLIGGKIIIFSECQTDTVTCYDLENDEWTEKAFGRIGHFNLLSCTVVPQL